MINLNPIKKELFKAARKTSVQVLSKLLAEFFSSEVIKLDEEYINDKWEIRSYGITSSTTQNWNQKEQKFAFHAVTSGTARQTPV